MAHDLVLDRQVRDWVLIPLTLCIILMMLLRQYVTNLFFSTPPAGDISVQEAREKAAVARSGLLRQAAAYVPESAFRQRKAFLIAKDTGLFQKKSEGKSAQEQMMTNPDMMADMMKKNIGGIVPQIAMGTFVNYFFSGFILGKIPFPLSPSFRPMLQRGIDLPSLDVTYFTSLSYYILLLFGLRGVFLLLFREATVDEAAMMRQQMTMGMGQMGMDTQKAFDAERSMLEMVEHKWRLEKVEADAAATLAAKLGRKRAPKQLTAAS